MLFWITGNFGRKWIAILQNRICVCFYHFQIVLHINIISYCIISNIQLISSCAISFLAPLRTDMKIWNIWLSYQDTTKVDKVPIRNIYCFVSRILLFNLWYSQRIPKSFLDGNLAPPFSLSTLRANECLVNRHSSKWWSGINHEAIFIW